MSRSPRLADLAESFPGLLFAIATGYGSDLERRDAIDAIEAGVPLKEAAARLGLPLWLRKLPAGVFLAPLDHVPRDPTLGTRLLGLVPPGPKAAAAWLDRILTAHQTGRPEITLWVAQQFRGLRPAANGHAFLTTLAWTWFSATDADARAGQLITERWKPSLGATRAAKAAGLWRERIALEVCLGPGISDPWILEGTASGFDFVALRTADDFIAEAARLDNCLDRYADRLLGRAVRIFSIREDGRSVACMEIATHEREPGHPVIAQLRGPHNRRASLEVWRAAYEWLGSHPLRLADRSTTIRVTPTARRRRQDEIWRPFLSTLAVRTAGAFETAILSRKPKRTPAVSPLSAPPSDTPPSETKPGV